MVWLEIGTAEYDSQYEISAICERISNM
jgi:hypothetical protein